ncbi:MAG: response regulator, partial [Paracoccaceae bacterium]
MQSNDLTGNSHNIPNVIKTILVVDDSKLQRRIVRSMLEKRGHRVIEAKSGEEGLVMSALTYPDLVLSDWMMPGMSGLEFCVKFRELGKNRYSYFILLTSKSAKDEVAQGLEMGAD